MEQIIKVCIEEWKNGSIITINDIRAEFCKKAMGFNFPQVIRKVISEQKVDEILADCG